MLDSGALRHVTGIAKELLCAIALGSFGDVVEHACTKS